jgi:hypothetical protein
MEGEQVTGGFARWDVATAPAGAELSPVNLRRLLRQGLTGGSARG